jgi:hypothetical protein
LSLRWLWRRPVAFVSFLTDIATPFALYAVVILAVAHAARGVGGPTGFRLPVELAVGYAGMLVSIGVRQIPHFRRSPADIRRLPLFVLQLTFLMAPIRIAAFATMLHQGWATRGSASRVRLGIASARSRMPAVAPRLAAACIVASVAAPGVLLVLVSRGHSTAPGAGARDGTGQEVILEAPSAEPPHR